MDVRRVNTEVSLVGFHSLINELDLPNYLIKTFQVHSKEQHAITLSGFKIIYDEKLPTLKPETISMVGLNLFSQLGQLSKITRNNSGEDVSNGNNVKMDQVGSQCQELLGIKLNVERNQRSCNWV